MESDPSIEQNLIRVRARVEQACHAAHRATDDVRLIAVSKTHASTVMRHAYAAGQRDFGENYAQELRQKASELQDLPGIRWHFIGPLQRNKVNQVVGTVSVIHTVDRFALLAAINARADQLGLTQTIYIQVNIGGEASKSGCTADELPELIAAAQSAPHIECVGLMAIPPAEDDPENSRHHFNALKELRDQYLPNARLSMGMSHDFEVAIATGATDIRIGTAIFGTRNIQ